MSLKLMHEQIIKDIKDLKIQGAENVAKAGVSAISQLLQENISENNLILYSKLLKCKSSLENARPTEPCLRNTLTLLFYDVNENNFNTQIKKNIVLAEEHFTKTHQVITEIGVKKIKDGMVVFTHCHSSAVLDILKQAKKNGIKFSVKNTETRPLFQGRITAKELANEKIPVEHFIDSAGRLAVKVSDIMIIGADAITTEGYVINKIGSEMFAEAAKKKDIPVYVCTDSWKFDVATVYGYDEIIEQRYKEEVWKDAPSGVKISNFAFEKINPNLITGVISELGIFSPEIFVEEVERHYPWLFSTKKKKLFN